MLIADDLVNLSPRMELNLTVDRGNTALKVALWDADGHLVANTVSFDGAEPASLALSILEEGHSIRAAIYCTVVAPYREADLANLRTLCTSVTDLRYDTPTPLTIGYATPTTLGVDRLAAAVGALWFGKGKPMLVADVGTAVTYDFVDASGCYYGGNIAPGISMRLAALHDHTEALPVVDSHGNTPVWGSTTEEALRSGALRGVVAELEYYKQKAGNDALTVLTGGSGALLIKAGIINFDYIHDPCLVMRGLNSILRYNETL